MQRVSDKGNFCVTHMTFKPNYAHYQARPCLLDSRWSVLPTGVTLQAHYHVTAMHTIIPVSLSELVMPAILFTVTIVAFLLEINALYLLKWILQKFSQGQHIFTVKNIKFLCICKDN